MHLKIKIFFILLCCAVLLTGCGKGEQYKSDVNSKNEQVTVVTYQGVGKIEALNPEKNRIKINHEEIKGFMEAMVMDFYVADKKLLTDLKTGDNIEFTLKYEAGLETITAIKKRN